MELKHIQVKPNLLPAQPTQAVKYGMVWYGIFHFDLHHIPRKRRNIHNKIGKNIGNKCFEKNSSGWFHFDCPHLLTVVCGVCLTR